MRSINSIIANALVVSPIGLAVKSLTGTTECVDLSHETKQRLEKSYCMNNGVLGFIYHGRYYLMKGYGYVDDLRDLGFVERSFPVFLSNGEVPAGIMTGALWESLPET